MLDERKVENKPKSGAGAPTPAQPCETCPLRRQSAFLPKTGREVEWTQRLKFGQRRVEAGKELIRQGEPQPELFTVYSGWAFRFQTLPDGRRQILNFFLPGDLVGFQASLLSAAEHSVEALTDVELCVFARRRVWRIFREMPELAFQLAWLGAREEGLVDDTLTSVGQLPARERMATFILNLFRRAQHLNLVENEVFRLSIEARAFGGCAGTFARSYNQDMVRTAQGRTDRAEGRQTASVESSINCKARSLL